MKKFLTVATLVAAASVATSASAAQFVYQGGLLKKGMGFSTQTWNLQECLYKMGVNGATLSNGQKNVDGKFGKLTHEAVRKFQIQKGLTMIDGIVGPETGPKYTEACAAFYTNDSNTSDVVVDNGEEGEIKSVEIKSGDDSKVLSNEKGQEFFEIEVEVEEEGSDVQIERMDLTFSTGLENGKLYKVIEKVNVEGFASKSTDDKDDWRGSDDNGVRLLGNAVVKAGEKETFVVALDVDELDEDDANETITLEKVAIRYTDEAGLSHEAPATAAADAESVEYEATNDLTFKSFEASDDMEKDMTVDVSSDTDKTELAIYEVEVEDEVKDAMFDTLVVKIENATEENIEKVYAKVDGTTVEGDFDATKVAACSDETSTTETACDTANEEWTPAHAVYTFDLDEMKFSAEDRFDVEIMADIAKQEEEVTSAAGVTPVVEEFVAKTYKVLAINFTEGEDVDGDDVSDIEKTLTDATVVTTSLGDVEYKVSELEKFTSANNADAEDNIVTFDVKVSNDKGTDLKLADKNAFVFDFDGIAGTEVVAIVMEGETFEVANFISDVVIEDGKSKEFSVKVTYTATSTESLDVELEKVKDSTDSDNVVEISVIEA